MKHQKDKIPNNEIREDTSLHRGPCFEDFPVIEEDEGTTMGDVMEDYFEGKNIS